MNRPTRAPLPLRLAVWLLPREVREEVLGDLVEERASRARALSPLRLFLWDWRQPSAALGWRGTRLGVTGRQPPVRTVGDVRARSAGPPVSWLDVKLGVRMLRKQPLLTVVAGLTLAIGIPSSLFPAHMMGIFGATFPVEDGDRIVGVRNWDTTEDRPAGGGLHEFAVWRETLRSFETIGAVRRAPWNVHAPDGRAAEVQGAEVSPSVFKMLRTPPIMGRVLLDADEAPGAADVVVISAALWESRFGEDPDIVGKTIGLGRVPYTVVGVMPDGFLFPMVEHLWVPLRADVDAYPVGGGPDLQVYGRLADGISQQEAQAELLTVGGRLASDWPETHGRLRPEVVAIARQAIGGRATGWVTEVLVVQLLGLGLLVVACGNVGTLMLARTAMRTGEISIRTALGASRRRILSQLFVELFVLAVVATGVGLIVADQVAAYAMGHVLSVVPYWFDPGIGPRSVLLALGLAAVCAVGAGVLPAWKATRPSVQRNLQLNAGGTTVRFGLLSSILIVAEVALSVGFLALGAAATVTYGMGEKGRVALDLERYLVVSMRTPELVSSDSASRALRLAASHEEFKRRLAANGLTGRVAMGQELPGLPHPDRRIEVEGRSVGDGAAPEVLIARVHADFFEDLGRPILSGRGFSRTDTEGGEDTGLWPVVVNTQFVEQMLGGTEAIGRRIRYLDGWDMDLERRYEIVGVVGPLAMNAQNPDRAPGVYHPVNAAAVHPMRFIIEVIGDPVGFVPQVRRIATQVDPDAVVQNPRVIADFVQRRRFEQTMQALFMSLLSLVGALLAATGLHALMSVTVSQRTREIGIRTALGASSTSIVSTIARRAAVQLFVGVTLGIAFASRTVQAINDMYLAVPSVPGLIAVVGTAVLLIGALACVAPTLRGLRIEPTEALRSEG